MLAAALALVILSCAHGPICDQHTIEWDHQESVSHYRVLWRTDAANVGHWQIPANDCFQACWPLPCRVRCEIPILRPAPGRVVYFQVFAVDQYGVEW